MKFLRRIPFDTARGSDLAYLGMHALVSVRTLSDKDLYQPENTYLDEIAVLEPEVGVLRPKRKPDPEAEELQRPVFGRNAKPSPATLAQSTVLKAGESVFQPLLCTKTVFHALRGAQRFFHAFFGVKTPPGILFAPL